MSEELENRFRKEFDELRMAISMAGKHVVGGTIIDTANFEGGQPHMVNTDILEKRLWAMARKDQP